MIGVYSIISYAEQKESKKDDNRGVAILCFTGDGNNRAISDPLIETWCAELKKRLEAPDCKVGKVVTLTNLSAEDTKTTKGYKSRLKDSNLPKDSYVFIVGHGSPTVDHHTGYQNTEKVREIVRGILPDAAFHIGACYGELGAGGRCEKSSASASGNEVGLVTVGAAERRYPEINGDNSDLGSAALIKMLCDPEQYDKDKDGVLSAKEMREQMCKWFTSTKASEELVLAVGALPQSAAKSAKAVRDEEQAQAVFEKIKINYDEKALLQWGKPTRYITYKDAQNKIHYRGVDLANNVEPQSVESGWPGKCPRLSGYAYAHDCEIKLEKWAYIKYSYNHPCYAIWTGRDVTGRDSFLWGHPVVNSSEIIYHNTEKGMAKKDTELKDENIHRVADDDRTKARRGM